MGNGIRRPSSLGSLHETSRGCVSCLSVETLISTSSSQRKGWQGLPLRTTNTGLSSGDRRDIGTERCVLHGRSWDYGLGVPSNDLNDPTDLYTFNPSGSRVGVGEGKERLSGPSFISRGDPTFHLLFTITLNSSYMGRLSATWLIRGLFRWLV